MASMLEIAKKLKAAQSGESAGEGLRPQRVLVYGDSGTGKTTLLAALAMAGFKLHIFDLDVGSDVLFAVLPEEYWGNVNIHTVVDLPENPRAAKLMDKVVRAQASWFCSEHGQPGTCAQCGDPKKNPDKYSVFDPRTLGLNDIFVTDTLTTLSKSAANFAAGSEVMSGDLAYFKAEFTHHDRQGMLLSNFLQRGKQLPCHVCCITHVDKIENASGSKELAPVMGTRNFARQITREFGHVVYTSVQNGKHKITSKSGALGLKTKSRGNHDVKNAEEFVQLFKVTAVQAANFTGSFDQVEGTLDEVATSNGAEAEAQEQSSVETKAPIKSLSSLAALAAAKKAT